MSKHSSSLAGSNSSQIGIWKLAGGRVISAVITLLLVVLIWFLLTQMVQAGGINAWQVILLIILAAALPMGVERSLASLPMSIGWRYRTSFLSAVGVFLGTWLVFWFLSGSGLSAWWLILIVFATYLGCMLATHFNEGLWEKGKRGRALVEEKSFESFST